jgi:hypothetical protein
MLPHERSLVKRLEGRPFALVGVNSDGPEELKKARTDNPIAWPSFKDRAAGKQAVSDVWKVHAWPTLYLIDHRGVIRKRWLGGPSAEVLDREIDKLVEAARADRYLVVRAARTRSARSVVLLLALERPRP